MELTTLERTGLVSHPTASQLEKINQYLPAGVAPLEAQEVFVLAGEYGVIACDNLISENYGKWSQESLRNFEKLLPGVPIMLDHDWEKVQKTVGKVFNAKFVKYSEAPDWAINKAGNFEYNRKIVADEGYLAVIADCYFPINSPIKESLRLGLVEDVSVGGFQYKASICPRCGINLLGENTPEQLKNCPIEGDCGIGREESKYIMRYFIRDGLFDVNELSFVWAGAAPAAGVITRKKQNPTIS